MHHRMARIGLVGAVATSAIVAVAASPAMADYSPNSHDVVGVGSDTVQYAGDFVADGSYVGSAGYNNALNKYKVINFDATPDANARLAYGPGGVGGASACAPGTGPNQGTGNDAGNHTNTPCTLNPTIVLRAGTKPVLRPNGSGDGAAAFAGDTTGGRNWITYSRASSGQDGTLPSSSYNVARIGQDNLQLLVGSTTNAIPLNRAQLGQIYSCNITNWQQLDNTSDNTATVHYYTAADVSGGFTPGANDVQLANATIFPIVPQAGSGTRKSFLADTGLTEGTLGTTCMHTGEENDPTAIAAAGAQAANAIEPMSQGRLNLFQGINGTGGGGTVPAGSNGKGGYFTDPSCKEQANGQVLGTGSCTSGTTSSITGAPLTPAVRMITTGTPSTCTTASGGSPVCSATDPTAYIDTRNLFIYFRKADVDSITPWQPGTLPNAVRTLFYNPCDPATSNNGAAGVDGANGPNGHGFVQADCITINGVDYGPGGQPYFQKAAGQANIAAAGINAVYGVSTAGSGGPFN